MTNVENKCWEAQDMASNLRSKCWEEVFWSAGM